MSKKETPEQRDEAALLYLAEMFPDRSIEQLQHIVVSASATANIQELVDKVLHEPKTPTTQPQAHNNNETESKVDEPEEKHRMELSTPIAAYEMISLVPPNTTSSLQQPDTESSPSALPHQSLAQSPPSPSAPSLSHEQEALQYAISDLHEELLSSTIPIANKQKCLTTLAHIMNNLIIHTDTEKYRVLPLRNAAFRAKIGSLLSAQTVLRAAGFEQLGTGDDEMLVMKEEDLDLDLIKDAKKAIGQEQSFIEEVLLKKGITSPPLTSPLVRKYDHIEDNPLYQTKRDWKRQQITEPSSRSVASVPVSTRVSREQLAAIAEHRLHPDTTPALTLPTSSSNIPAIRPGRIMNLAHNRHLRDEINSMRKEKKDKWLNTNEGRKRVYTMADLAEMHNREMEARAKMGTGMLADDELLSIAKEAVRLTNEYRHSVGISNDLVWHQSLAEIGWQHSYNMGQHKVPFNHDGFNERAAKYPFPHNGAGENLFMCHGIAASLVAKQAVDGWINSPGHRKNLEGHWNYCGIGCYRNYEGAYYLTQLFASV